MLHRRLNDNMEHGGTILKMLRCLDNRVNRASDDVLEQMVNY